MTDDNSVSQDEKWYTPQVHKDRVWRSYVDSYDDHAFGILQENGQNSFDAYPPGTPAKEMKIIIKYDSDKRILTHRDFETLGMSHCRDCDWGLKSGDIECTASDCAWGCFHNMGYSGKIGSLLGSRGMGKCLQLLSGSRMVVRTTLSDKRHNASLWEKVKGDWHWRYAPEFDIELSSPGMELISFDIDEKIHDRLLQVDEIVEELQERWFRLIAQGAIIEYILVKGGKQDRRIVKSPKEPHLDDSQGREKSHLMMNVIVVKHQGKRIGELRNLNIFLSKTPFDEEDRHQGIAIVKNGKQTISRFSEFPEEIPENIRKRIFGYCDAISTSDEPFLREAENAQHTGYQWAHPFYKAVRYQLRTVVKSFVEPFISSGGERVSEKDHEEAKEILDLLNSVLAEVPEFNFFGREESTQKKRVKMTPKDYIYLSRLEFENRNYKRGEKALIELIIKNPTSKETVVVGGLDHYDPTPIVLESNEDATIIPAGTPENPSTKSIKFEISFDNSQSPGIHWVQALLSDGSKNALVDNEGNRIRERRAIYCEMDPLKRTGISRSGGGDIIDGEGKGGGEGSSGLAAIEVYRRLDLTDSFEAWIDMSLGAAFVNFRGRRVLFAKAISKTKQGAWPTIIEVIAEKILEKKAEMDAGEKEQWQAEELKNEIIKLQNLKATVIRKTVEKLK